MDDSTFWLKLWKYVIVGFCVVVLAGIGSCSNYRYQLRKMVEAGSDPVLAACALDQGNSGSSTNCILSIAQQR